MIATPEMEQQREALTELDLARREHEDAVAGFRSIEQQEQELLATRVDASGRQVPVFDQIQREARRAKINADRLEAADRLLAARARLTKAARGAANDKLAQLRPAHAEASRGLAKARAKFERATVALLDAGWELGEAWAVEQRAATKLANAAMEALDDDGREQLRIAASGSVPIAIREDGEVETEPRVRLEPFDGPFSPARRDYWSTVADLALSSRQAAEADAPKAWRAAIRERNEKRSRS